jgi:putative heme iron utilization protein
VALAVAGAEATTTGMMKTVRDSSLFFLSVSTQMRKMMVALGSALQVAEPLRPLLDEYMDKMPDDAADMRNSIVLGKPIEKQEKTRQFGNHVESFGITGHGSG